jgi:hypothetical protein
VQPRILFIGNSYTYVNDLPAILHGLAARAGLTIETVTHASGGSQLEGHALDPRVRELLAQHWDWVVFQEQSQLPSLDAERGARSLPALRGLAAGARRSGSRPVLFATWAYRHGDLHNRPAGDSYEAMQRRLDAGFSTLAQVTGVSLVPVGEAWAAEIKQHPAATLWADDGAHPGLEGSYLAACVFLQALLNRSPVGNTFTAGLAPERARELQGMAARTAKPLTE